MPRRKNSSTEHHKNQVSGENSKIRKRGCYSSPTPSTATSSSLAQKNRVKRAILAGGKRAGSSTAVPSWKMQDLMRSPGLLPNDDHGEYCSGKEGNNHSNNHLSARRLGAEMTKSQSSSIECVGKSGGGGRRRRMMYGSGEFGYNSNGQVVDQAAVYAMDQKKDGSNEATMAAGHRRTNYPPRTVEADDTIQSRLKDVRNSLQTSKELVKVLLNSEQRNSDSSSRLNSSRLTLVSALRVELGQARIQIDSLIQTQRQNSNLEIQTLLRQFAAEKSVWKRREHDRILESVATVTQEVEAERKLRKRAERLNKRLGKELAETREEVMRLKSEVGNERRAREILEQTCEELARGVGEQVERELKRVREEVDKEREMLQLADVLREERVQMKLQEARYEYEEKNEAVERLRDELEGYLGVKMDDVIQRNDDDDEINDDDDEINDDDVESDNELHSTELHSTELHSIELERLKWRFDKEVDMAAVAQLLAPSDSEVFKGRRSLSEKIQWESICLQRKTSADEMSSKFKLEQQQQMMIMNGNGTEEISNGDQFYYH